MQPKKPAHYIMSITTRRKKTSFHTYVAPRSLTWNLLQRCPPGRQVYIPAITPANPAEICVRKILFLFHTLCIFSYETSTHVPIKLGTHKEFIKGLIKAYLYTNFSWNLKDYSHKIRSKICHAYKVNCLKEWVKTWHVHRVTIPFYGLKWF